MVVALVIALVAGASCSREGGKEGGGGRYPATLTIASIAYPYKGEQRYTGQTAIIIDQGWLKAQLAKRGVTLQWLPVPTAIGAPMINEGFAGKRVDFASYGDFPALIANAGGIATRLIVPVGRGQNVYLVVRKGLAARGIEDLKGKRIALHRGRPWELPFAKLLDQKGLRQSDFRILNINPPASLAALAAGDVDAVVLLSDGILAEQKGFGRILWSTRQAPPDWRMRAELFGRKDFVDQYPELTQLVADAYVRAARWSADPANRARVIDYAVRGEAPRSVIEAEYADPTIAWKDRFSPLFDRTLASHYEAAADYAFARGLIRKPVDADALFDPRFVARALKEQKLEGYWQPAGGPLT
jgi:sulfonate transport system substrate-binding protein